MAPEISKKITLRALPRGWVLPRTVGCADLQWPDAVERGAEQAKSTELQQLAASWDQITDGFGTIHGGLACQKL